MATEANAVTTGDENENLSTEEQQQLEQDRLSEQGGGEGEGERQQQRQQPQQRQRQETVPHQALHEERRLRQEAEKRAKEREGELERERGESKKLRDRTERILQSIATGLNPDAPDPATGEKPLPALDKDPLGHVLGQLERQGKLLDRLAGNEGERIKLNRAQGEVAEIAGKAQELEAVFMKTTADYQQASTYLQQWRHAELEEMGYTNPQQRQQMIAAEAIQIARAAIAQNKNPAEVVYNAAKRRGYKPAASAEGEGEGQGEGEGERRQEQQQQRDDEARLKAAQRGQTENRSLGQARGGAKRPLTVDALMAMDDEAFDKAMSTPEGRALMGN